MTRRICFAAVLPVALLLTTGPLRAAGMNCAKAVSAVEKTICADPKLKQADADVADAFAEALRLAPDPNAVRASQRQWLAARNACPDAACLTARHEERRQELTGLAATVQQQALAERARLWTQLGWPGDCEASFQDMPASERPTSGVDVHDLGDGRRLYAVLCFQAAYQGSYVVMLQDRPDGPARLLRFPLYDREGGKVLRSEEDGLAGSLDFNETAKTLTVFSKARGVGDCGSRVVYAFPRTGAPKVVEARARECPKDAGGRFVEPERWPLVDNP
jgi:uncharacterized protein